MPLDPAPPQGYSPDFPTPAPHPATTGPSPAATAARPSAARPFGRPGTRFRIGFRFRFRVPVLVYPARPSPATAARQLRCRYRPRKYISGPPSALGSPTDSTRPMTRV